MKGKLCVGFLLVTFVLVMSGCGGDKLPRPVGDVISDTISTSVVGQDLTLGVFLVLLVVVVAIIASIIIYGSETDRYSRQGGEPRWYLFVGLGILVVGLIGAFFFGSYTTVDQGQVGVVVRQGRADRLAQPGANFVFPYLEKVVRFPTRGWTYITMGNPVENGSEDYRDWPVDLISSDGVQVQVKYTIQGSLNPAMAMEVYENYGSLENAIAQLVKNPSRVVVRRQLQGFTARDLISDIDRVEGSVVEYLGPIMADGGLKLGFFGFRKPEMGQFEEELNNARIAEQQAVVAQEKVAIAEADAARRAADAEGNKQVTILNAEAAAEETLVRQRAEADAALYRTQQDAEGQEVEAEAQAYAILALAQAEAEGNALVAASLSSDLIEYNKWLRWNGQLPSVWMGEGLPIINIAQ